MNDIISMMKKYRDYVCNHPAQSAIFSYYLLVFSFLITFVQYIKNT